MKMETNLNLNREYLAIKRIDIIPERSCIFPDGTSTTSAFLVLSIKLLSDSYFFVAILLQWSRKVIVFVLSELLIWNRLILKS